ncbi:MAG: nuclear transport factor 2 family protein, partial [Blastocatellia bacterium]
LLESREAVWRAWFTNDRVKLDQLIPAELIAINSGGGNWDNRAEVLAGAKSFADSGAKLVRLEFPRTEIQAYGRTVIIYTTYLFETELNGKREISSGRATEIFVWRDGQFVNTGWHLDSGK